MKESILGKGPDGTPLTAAALASELWGRPGWITPQALKDKYGYSDDIWPQIRQILAEPYRDLFRSHRISDDASLLIQANQQLRSHALAVPDYARMSELQEIITILNSDHPSKKACEVIVFGIVMGPATRARLLTGRYMKEKIFDDLVHIIDSAYFAYARGNIAASFFTILPVIEGFLLRWQGHHGKGRSLFKEQIKWVRETPQRNPLLALPLFSDEVAETCAVILEEHFFKDTRQGTSYNDFNRHLALHMLADRCFYGPPNVMRAFLLLDMLSLLYISEQDRGDPIMYLRPEDERPHAEAYRAAMTQQILNAGSAPEDLLWRSHERLNWAALRNR